MTTPALNVVVIGAGVIGLTTALAAARAGHDVKVISAQRPEETVSAVAAAIWAPYHAEPAAWINPWAAATYDILARLADTTPEAGVQMREGIVVNREGSAPLAWPETVVGSRPALLSELPRGTSSGTVCTVPIATMPTYLKWLQKECTALGVAWEWRTARSLVLEADPGAVIVLATGLQSLGLHPDDGMYPVRGQVAIIGNTRVDRWIIDDANPAGPSYVIPRTDEVICGGTAETGAASLTPDPETQKRILETTMDLSPALSKGTFLGSKVGLRPGRHLIRLELRHEDGIPVIHSYGHGGSGVTVSWGVANATLELIHTASQHPSN